MPSQQLLSSLGESLGSGNLALELIALAGGSQSGYEISATDPAYGVIGDGIANDAAALQRAIDAAQDAGAGSVLLIPPGVYMVQDPTTASAASSPLQLSGDDITIIGWGATLKIGANGVGHAGVIEIQGSRNRIYGLTIDCNGGVSLGSKDNSGFKINGTTSSGYTGSDNILSFCSVINGTKAEVDITEGEECFVITNGLRNRLENCLARDTAWQGFRTTGGHTRIVDCTVLHHRGNGLRVLDGEAVYITGFIAVQSGAGGRSSLLIDPGSAEDSSDSDASNDSDKRIDLAVIRDCYLINRIAGPDGSVNALKVAACRECIIEGCYLDCIGSDNSALSLEDCVHQVTIRNCFITPALVLRPSNTSGSVFLGAINATVSSASLNLDVNGDGVLDGAANYVVYTVTGHGLVLGKTVWIRGSSVTEYNGPQEVVAVTATTFTTNRKYVSASIGSVAWGHSGVDKLDVIDCTFHNDQANNAYSLKDVSSPYVNIENCRFRNKTENTTKQGHILTAYTAGDIGMLRFRLAKNRFYFRTTNICRAVRMTTVTAEFLTSGKTIVWGNELFNDRTSANVYLVDTYDSGDTSASTYANRATLFASDGDRVSCYTGTAKPTGTDVSFLRGDRIRNTSPSAGGAPGFVCTTAGAVGTWKNEANLEA